MVQAPAALGQKTRNRRIGRSGLEKLDPRLPGGKHGHTNLFRRHRLAVTDGEAEGFVKRSRLVEVSRSNDNMIPAMLDAARAEATLGEICDALRAEWGVYREPARF